MGVVVLAVVDTVVVLLVLILVTATSMQKPQENSHVSTMKSALFWHSPNLIHTGQSSFLSTHSLVAVGVLTVAVPASVTVLLVLVTSTAAEVKSME